MWWRCESSWRRPPGWLPVALLAMLQVAGGVRAAAGAAVSLRASGIAGALAGVTQGWQQVSLPATGSYFWLYVPPSWDGSQALPLVLFLHGAGSTPDAYLNFLFPAAEAAGCLVAAPKSSSPYGWGTGDDEQIVAATRAAAAGMVPVDPLRVGIAGHSAGGAYAYLLAYGTVSRYSAVFSMSAPFYQVSSVADPAYKAPIHMYYGTTDPNYTGGAYSALQQQWNGLGISWESDIEAGFGHNTWPTDSMAKGFEFLVSKTYGTTCSADSTHLCLQQGRFRVAVDWQDGRGNSGAGSVTPAVTADSGVFWFFAPDNWELLVKVLDGCALNRRIWVFAAATTNVHYTLTVTDTVSGQARTYQNPGGQAALPVNDTDAFDVCP
jgi:hypothetical protein